MVAGLGNPGPAYAPTRHNVGFRVVDCLAHRRGLRWRNAAAWDVALAPRGPLLVKPQLYMNRSGVALAAALEAAGLDPGALLVVVDDVDLPLGTLRMRPAGGPGTHNGLRDLCDRIGRGFARLRLGVGGADAAGDLADYVLAPFGPEQVDEAERAVERAADAVESAVDGGIQGAMSRFNGPLPPADRR